MTAWNEIFASIDAAARRMLRIREANAAFRAKARCGIAGWMICNAGQATGPCGAAGYCGSRGNSEGLQSLFSRARQRMLCRIG
ncbi:hypothetical protein EAH76_22275 [Sphingomonas glacialis]|uniref:Uncharacterized protein n=1 Tax=Sphingomonas glacialis TaxID=658225 RepID=A0A502FCH4_9SPHN|nr:hypothetical protein EAH76_22275 [Sphingomonas glacialis]